MDSQKKGRRINRNMSFSEEVINLLDAHTEETDVPASRYVERLILADKKGIPAISHTTHKTLSAHDTEPDSKPLLGTTEAIPADAQADEVPQENKPAMSQSHAFTVNQCGRVEYDDEFHDIDLEVLCEHVEDIFNAGLPYDANLEILEPLKNIALFAIGGNLDELVKEVKSFRRYLIGHPEKYREDYETFSEGR